MEDAGEGISVPQEVPAVMKAVYYEEYGSDPKKILKVKEDFPVPRVPKDGVVIKVKAAAINPIDWKIMKGMISLIQFSPFPFVPGFDASGVVVRTGPKCKRLKVGDEVYAMANFKTCGAFAEYMALDSHLVSLKPKSLTHAETATIPLAALTSWQALLNTCKVKEGHKVLILGGSGGTGSWGIQFAKHKGCFVATTCSERNVEYVQSLGADQVIDYGKEDWSEVLRGQNFDSIYDCVGGYQSWVNSEKVLKKGGSFVTLTGDNVEESKMTVGGLLAGLGTKLGRNIQAAFSGTPHYYGFLTNANGKDLSDIAELIDSGTVKLVSYSTFAFDDVADMFEQSMSARARGKLVLLVDAEEQAREEREHHGGGKAKEEEQAVEEEEEEEKEAKDEQTTEEGQENPEQKKD